MGIFSGASEAGISGNSGPPYFPAGFEGIVEIESAKSKKSAKGPYSVLVVTAKVMEVLSGGDENVTEGQTRSYVYKINNEWVLPDINQFAVALMGADVEDLGPEEAVTAALEAAGCDNMEELCEALFDENADHCEGRVLKLQRFDRKTKNNAVVRKAIWAPVEQND